MGWTDWKTKVETLLALAIPPVLLERLEDQERVTFGGTFISIYYEQIDAGGHILLGINTLAVGM